MHALGLGSLLPDASAPLVAVSLIRAPGAFPLRPTSIFKGTTVSLLIFDPRWATFSHGGGTGEYIVPACIVALFCIFWRVENVTFSSFHASLKGFKTKFVCRIVAITTDDGDRTFR